MKHTEMIMVINAHAEGKAIQYSDQDDWFDASHPCWDFSLRNYRVKPELAYKTTTVDTGRELFKYVEIKALEDAVRLSDIYPCDMTDAQCDEWNALKNLIN